MSPEDGHEKQPPQPPQAPPYSFRPLPPGLIDPAGMTGFYPPGLLRGFDPFTGTFQPPSAPQAIMYDPMTGQPVQLPPPDVNMMLQKHLQPDIQTQYQPPGFDNQQPDYQPEDPNWRYPPQSQ